MLRFLFINVKMRTIIGILTYMNMKNVMHSGAELSMKKYNLGIRFEISHMCCFPLSLSLSLADFVLSHHFDNTEISRALSVRSQHINPMHTIVAKKILMQLVPTFWNAITFNMHGYVYVMPGNYDS